VSMQGSSADRLVARIGKPHGLRGEVTVRVHTDDPEARFVPGTVFGTEAAPGTGVPKALTLAAARLHREIWLLRFEEIPDRTGAESLRGTTLHLAVDEVAEEDADEEDENAWYEDELVGLTAVDPDGATVGTVTALHTGAAQDLLAIRLTDGVEALVPFVAAIVPVVDVGGGRVVVDAPPGLLDLARE